LLSLLKMFGVYFDRKSFICFFSVGLITSFVYFGLFFLLYHAIGIGYRLALTITFPISVLLNYYLNSRISFGCKYGIRISTIAKFLTLPVINYLIHLAFVEIFVMALGLSAFIGLICAAGFCLIVNYLLSSHWVFSDRHMNVI
jgi:putative flippase GtrA